MKHLILLVAIAVFSPVLMGSSCKKITSNGNPCSGMMCTEIFAMFTVEVKDASGGPVKLDEVYTVRSGNGARIDLSQDMNDGRYTVIDDSYRQQLANTIDDFR